MKFYNHILGNRDYSLMETVHYGLRLPDVCSTFGEVDSVSVSNWACLKRGHILNFLQRGDRATHMSKLEIFNYRSILKRPPTIQDSYLQNISFYAFWRMYDCTKGKLVRRRREKMIAVNGLGWPTEAATSHPRHSEYARKTLYAYMPCVAFRESDYIDAAVNGYWDGDWMRTT